MYQTVFERVEGAKQSKKKHVWKPFAINFAKEISYFKWEVARATQFMTLVGCLHCKFVFFFRQKQFNTL